MKWVLFQVAVVVGAGRLYPSTLRIECSTPSGETDRVGTVDRSRGKEEEGEADHVGGRKE